jgi:predicted metal-binding protein
MAVATTEAPRTVIVSRADMMRYHDPERIQGYCRSCEKYGAYWSCPPFAEPPLARLGAWTCAVLVTQKTRVAAGSTQEELIGCFLDARKMLCEAMRRQETAGAVAVVAGHCDGCTACTRSRGIACCAPSRLRYSLEALGFDVTGLAEGLAGQKVHWPAHGMPDYLMTVGALLCPSLDVAAGLDL